MSPDPELRQLSPPVFDGQCVKCGSRAKQLPWQVSFIDGSWGAVCDSCARPFLIRLLRRSLPSMFSEGELLEIFCGLGLGKKESELLLKDFEKEGIFWKTEKGFQWLEPLVIPISGLGVRKRAYRRLSSEEIFLKCVKLSREIRSRTDQGCR